MIQRQKGKSPIRKRSFLLFELMVSLALITLCFFPLVKAHSTLCREEMKLIMELQMEQTVQNAFCKVKETLYQHQIPWKTLKKGTSGTLEETFMIATAPNSSKEMSCNYTFSQLDYCSKTSTNKKGLALKVDLSFSPTRADTPLLFTRTLYVEMRDQP